MNRVVRGICLSKRFGLRSMKGTKFVAGLQAECGFELMEITIKKEQLLYSGHVARMPTTRLEKLLLNRWLLPEV